MPEYLETQVDKFFFKVATDRLYSREGVWVKKEGASVKVGLTDYLQQLSGDIAFADVKPMGTEVTPGDEVASIETIKVDAVIHSPIHGKINLINPKMQSEPEAINQDPYGEGWLCQLEVTDWEEDSVHLLAPDAYFVIMKAEAEEEAKKL